MYWANIHHTVQRQRPFDGPIHTEKEFYRMSKTFALLKFFLSRNTPEGITHGRRERRRNSRCVCVCVCVCMYVRCMYVCMYVCLFSCTYVHTYVCVCVCVCTHMYVCTYVRMYVSRNVVGMCIRVIGLCAYVCVLCCVNFKDDTKLKWSAKGTNRVCACRKGQCR